MLPLLSVVIPTYNEAANVGPLLRELRTALAGVEAEFIVVDDDSKDGTAAAARKEGARVVVRKAERGLATAVVRGIREATGTYVAVMDADFQHPPEAVRRLVDKAVATDADLVLGSRYAEGGSEGAFALHRRAISWGAATLARVALPPVRAQRITDPMTGLFLVRRDRVPVDDLRPTGYKVLLEIMGRSGLRRVEEVPFTFQDRRGGTSKLGGAVILQYLWHVLALGLVHPENRRAGRFALVGLSGVGVNLGVLWLLHGLLGLHDLVAVPVAVEVSILSNFLLNDRFTFHDRRTGHAFHRLAKFNAVSLFALVVNFAAYIALERGAGFHYLAAEALAIGAAFAANYLGNLHWTYGDGATRAAPRRRSRRMAWWLPFMLLSATATWLYVHDLDAVEDIYFDEHYYVSVARQMDNGVWLDPCWGTEERPLNFEHPPLAKLLIAGSVRLFDTDHAVFEGCRDPDKETELSELCRVLEYGEVVATGNTPKACYDAYTARLRMEGNPYAWRLPSALLGAAAVTFTALAARRIFQDDVAGLAAGALLLVDGLMLTSSRIALLDIFAAGFAAAALWVASHPTKRGVVGAGLFLGLAFACKYTALFAGLPVLAVALWSHHRAGLLTRRRFDLAFLAVPFLPVLVWALSYLPWWVIWSREHGFVWAVGHLTYVTGEAFQWDTAGVQSHPYQSTPLEWFTLARPVYYFLEADAGGPGVNRYIYGIGNPVVWWTSLLVAAVGVVAGAAFLVLRWKRTPEAGGRWTVPPILVAALLPLLAYGGFFALARATFLFYMAIVLPFLVLPLAGTLGWLWRRGAVGRTAAAAFGLVALAAFLHYYPVLMAEPVSTGRYHDILGTVPWMRE